jgi:hypothetical protein
MYARSGLRLGSLTNTFCLENYTPFGARLTYYWRHDITKTTTFSPVSRGADLHNSKIKHLALVKPVAARKRWIMIYFLSRSRATSILWKKVPVSCPRRLPIRWNSFHNFFDSQPTTGDIYIPRHICHNWSNANSLKIIQIVQAMKPTSRIILVEGIVVPSMVVNPAQERYMRWVNPFLSPIYTLNLGRNVDVTVL